MLIKQRFDELQPLIAVWQRLGLEIQCKVISGIWWFFFFLRRGCWINYNLYHRISTIGKLNRYCWLDPKILIYLPYLTLVRRIYVSACVEVIFAELLDTALVLVVWRQMEKVLCTVTVTDPGVTVTSFSINVIGCLPVCLCGLEGKEDRQHSIHVSVVFMFLTDMVYSSFRWNPRSSSLYANTPYCSILFLCTNLDW